MANFNIYEDDDYGGLFLTQQSSQDQVVSLEENGEFKTVKDDRYSDISDVEQDSIEEQMR